ncbi:hypothetical protein SAMN05428985_10227 [Nocardioides sp. YR527]|uniref:hypothetical protein n=1 Tax=Nocardioides sp. YR527 TaxID=1881028 RepID=UPI00088571BB|nr:hypothetical protein [Nocardioides sp. YR527]SDJ96171.1 hypothetical protein SAMN05428985_10227 [Nocardioides sp. YR527]
MTDLKVLEEFLSHEADAFVRRQLAEAIAELGESERYFTYDVYNVRLDGEAGQATIEDELDPSREFTLDIIQFAEKLREVGEG